MKRIKQKSKIKEPVRLRVKSLSNGNKSLYLDTYQKGKRAYEFLHLYLIPERTTIDRELNAATMQAATAIKAKRTLAIINGKADIRTADNRVTVEEWIKNIIMKKKGQSSESSIRLMKRLLRHLNMYKSTIKLTDVDKHYCIGFTDYLRSAKALNSSKSLLPSTQFELLNALSIILNEAVRAEVIKTNPMHLLNSKERIRKPESIREYLSPEEVKSLIEIASSNIQVGDDIAAFLFCCFCGLRYSDISNLVWENIVDTDHGKIIVTTMKKTKRRVEIPISKTAASILPKRGNRSAKVFSFPTYGVTLRKLRKIAEDAGIKKK